MRLDLKDIIHVPGASKDFQFQLDLSQLEFYGSHPISRPVEAAGTVTNHAGALELTGTARSLLDLACDRCGKEFSREKAVPLDCLLADELEDEENDEIVLLEGSEVEVPVGANSKNAMVPLATVNTKNILFICGGAFPDLEDVIKQRLTKQSSMGFGGELKDKYDKDPDILSKVTVEDLRAFGMIPEFLGRLPIVCTLQGLTKEMLIRILKEPKNAILKQYHKLLALDEVDLEFDDGALEAIADKAMKKDTGARALRAIIEDFMLDIMYEIPKDDNIGRVTITKDYIEGTGGPMIEIRGAGYALPEHAASTGV